MPTQGARVFGPYQSAGRWRVICVLAGARKAQIFASRDEAQAAADSLRASVPSAAALSLGAALDEYLSEKRRQGLRPLSLRNLESKLRRHLDADASLAQLDAAQAQALYLGWTQTLAVATQRMILRYARGFFAWCVGRRYLAVSPFAEVRPVGTPRRGKPQLRIDEARQLYAHLLAKSEAGDDRALGLVLMLLLGLRTAEVKALAVRDVDADGSHLCVAMGEYAGKTAHAPRRLQVAQAGLRDLLLARRQARPGDAPLLGGAEGLGEKALPSQLARACRALSLPRVCPHSLRGLHASLAVEHGASIEHVAAALGHSHAKVTQQHYLAPGSEQLARARGLLSLLLPAPAAQAPVEAAPVASAALPTDSRAALVLSLLRSLSPAERAWVLAAAGRDD
jgi:integrase